MRYTENFKMSSRKQVKKTNDGLAILDAITGNDPEIRGQMDAEGVNLRIARDIQTLRTQAGLSQSDLAKRIGTTQSVISRLEDAEYEGHSLSMLQRIAGALNRRVDIRFVPIKKEPALA
jgi:ribosome-binding protein aMBF1 (putative translation factor)